VSSSNNPDIQVLINAINHFLSNYGKTIFLDIPVNYKQGNDYLMNSFVNELENSEVSAVIFFESNPVYDYPDGFKISNLLSNVDLKISISDRFNETSSLSDYISPNHHYLES
jgi:molybdopterin-containing oxidoreductase family iron-sulfur binding subunit